MCNGAEGFALCQPSRDDFHVFIRGHRYQTEILAFRDDLGAKSRILRAMCRCQIWPYSDPMVRHTKGIYLGTGHVAADAALRLIPWTDGSVLRRRQRMTLQTNTNGGLRNGC